MTSPRSTAPGMPVAIVGIGCRFPGGVTGPDSFWQLLCDGVDAITEIPATRIDAGHYYDPRPATPGRMMTRWGGFLDRIEEFDAGFFGISPREAERLDPQQRLLLETAWEALEDAGQDVLGLEGSATAVFIGQWLSDFEARLFADPEGVDFYMTTGSGRYAASGRLSYALGLRGPSLTIDSACSSSLAAVHLAVGSIRSGESDLALAGGVNVILQPHITVAYSQSRMMAPDGRCKFGDASADGYVRSEGAGVVVLKPLARALDDGDRVYAVIRGSAVNNDGRSSNSMGTPSRIGQEELLRRAYRDAGLSPGNVGYIEAHGTGTRAGDPVEFGALGAVLAEGRAPGHRVCVGSVKTNIGHTEGAAGVAGLIKVALALHHGEIPPSLHCREPNPAIPWAEAPYEVARTRRAWPASVGTRVAGVSAFGIAGTNAHIVLGEAPGPVTAPDQVHGRPVSLLALSAKAPEALRSLAGRYADLLARAPAPSLHDVCWSAATRRASLEHRAAFVASDPVAMVEALQRHAAGEPAHAEGTASAGAPPKVAFVFPGQGAQWTGMALELLAREPVFRAALERCDDAIRPFADWSIVGQLAAEPGTSAYQLDRIDVIQPVLVALAIAYAELWRSLGVTPDAVVGHSMGEIGAAYFAGALDLRQAMRIVCRRSALMRRTSGQGAMTLVELSMDEARTRIGGRERRLSVAVSNSPRASVISGEPDAVQQVMAELERDQVFCRLVKVDVASHSPQMEPLAAELASDLAGLVPGAASIPIYSTVLGRRAGGHEFDAAYWASNLRQPVLFSSATNQLLEDGISVFIELGPHPVLLPSIEQTALSADRSVVTWGCGRRDEPQQAAVLSALGGLWASGYPVDWRRTMPESGRPVPLPPYPWQRERHWAEAADLAPFGSTTRASSSRPDDESLNWLYRLHWVPVDPPPAQPPMDGSAPGWLVLASDETGRAALAAALTSAGATAEAAPLATLEAVVEQRRSGGGAPLRGIIVVAPDDTDAAYLPLRVARALLEPPSSSLPRLWFVTRGGQSVATDSPARVSVEHGALWGTARVVAEEHPDLWGGVVDLAPAGFPPGDAALLVRHLLGADGEDQVAFRGRQRFVLRLAAAERERTSAPCAWRSDAAYLISGGLGGVGLHLARTMVAHGVRRLVLVGRTPLPPREEWSLTSPESTAGQRISAVRALEAMGAAVQTASVDVGDEAQLRAFLARYAAEAWPPIRGVIHAAGNFENRLVRDMDREAFDAVVRPKLRGAQLLDRLLPDLDVFVLLSSTGAFLAQPGQANYAAANAGLDALAQDRRARGLAGLSIQWGVWADTGLVKGAAGEQNVAELARQGIRSFSPERGTALFGWLCGSRDSGVAVLPVDWSAFRSARAGRDYPLYRDLHAGAAQDSDSQTQLRVRLATAGLAERRQLIEGVVRETVGRVLKIAPSRLDPRKALGTMGLNSLMAMELRNRLEAALGRSLSATLAWNYPTVEALAAHLAGADSPATAPGAPTATSQPVLTDVSAQLNQVAGLSDEEAALALRAGRPRAAP